MNKNILECCVDSVESAIAAQIGGGDRLELCGNLVIGGTTPTKGLFTQVKQNCDLPINVLIRPRFGDFLYSDYEFLMMLEEVSMFRELSANGVVIGMLNSNGTLDLERMEKLIKAAGDMSITLHRAFDVCIDPLKALEQAKDIGISTILTSGQEVNCVKGRELIHELVVKSQNKIEIMVGAGVNAKVIQEYFEYLGTSTYHMSGKIVQDSNMEYRKEQVSMGLPSMGEYEIWRTDPSEIRAAKDILNKKTRSYPNR